jgi:microcin C transport system substrate-binding protein
MWHSREADRKSSNNIYGFKNAKVDQLIEKQLKEFDIGKRMEILREIDHLIQLEMPMVMIWMIDFQRIIYWNKFGTPETVYDKFNDEASALHYWWVDPDLQADLESAKANVEGLPPTSDTIVFDEIFSEN